MNACVNLDHACNQKVDPLLYNELTFSLFPFPLLKPSSFLHLLDIMHSPPTSTEDDIPVHKEQQQQEFKTGNVDGGRKDITIDMERGVTPRPEEYEFGNDDDDSKGSLALIYDTYRPWFQLSLS